MLGRDATVGSPDLARPHPRMNAMRSHSTYLSNYASPPEGSDDASGRLKIDGVSTRLHARIFGYSEASVKTVRFIHNSSVLKILSRDGLIFNLLRGE